MTGATEHDQTLDDQAAEALWDEVTAADDAAVADSEQADAQDDQAAAPAATAEPAPAPAEGQAADPFAGLPEPVRNALAAIPQMEHRVRSAEGRVAALQRELAQRQAAPETAAPRASSPKLEALRGELPEVAEALDEMRGTTVDADSLRQQVRAELAAELQEELLSTNHPEWQQTVTGNDFQLWLASQDAAYRDRIASTSKASELMGALRRFGEHQAKASARATLQASRGRRLAAAVAPTGSRRVPAKAEDDMTDEELWNHITRGA